MSERVLRGAPASPGLAAGPARVLHHPSGESARSPVPEELVDAEAARARGALAEAGAQLEAIAAGLRADGRGDEAEIVETGVLMAGDPVLASAVAAAVLEQRRPAATALLEAAEAQAETLAALPDPMLAARADDVRSLGRRAARIAASAALNGAAKHADPEAPGPTEPPGATVVLVAEELGPADVAEHGDRLAGIALSGGAVTAHAAIVARSLGIPMVVMAGPGLLGAADGASLVIDGTTGDVVLEPDTRRLEEAREACRDRTRARARELADSGLPAVTRDGRRIRVLVNAASTAEVAAGLAAGAEGAGLIRTELAFLDAPSWPSRLDHEAMLAPLIDALGAAPATVRVLDFGGDKLPPFLDGDARRGMELLLAHPGALRAQLAAIAAVARRSEDLRVLLPLVRGPDDVRMTRALLEALGADVRLGAMIELPEAAVAARAIAAECDFMSVGTNDLTHATLGTDRFSPGEAPAHDPRVLRHIARAAEAAREAGIPLEVCGEAASEQLTVPLLVGLGADELSVGAARVGAVRAWIRALDASAAAQLARRALEADGPAAVERLARPPAS